MINCNQKELDHRRATRRSFAFLLPCLFSLSDVRSGLALSSPPSSRAQSSSSRRSFVGQLAILTPWIAVSSNPEASVADAPAGILSPNGASASLVRPPTEQGSWKPSKLTTKLGKERILAAELSPLNQFPLPFSEQELYYPPFLFGSWNISATLKSKQYPYGELVVPSNSLIEGSPRNRNEQVGETTSYETHYFSTLENAAASQTKSKIIPDRAFNVVALSKAYRQLAPVQDVDWDYRKDPAKLTLRYFSGAMADDLRPLGQRRGEVFFTARASEEGVDESSGELTFAAAERSRSVTLAPGNVIVSDSETITEFRKLDDDHVTAISRVAVYLTPNPNSREGILWQQVGGKSIAFFNYELQMTRNKESVVMDDGSKIERACVKTPKDSIQCS